VVGVLRAAAVAQSDPIGFALRASIQSL
jgi:hypothetical protein